MKDPSLQTEKPTALLAMLNLTTHSGQIWPPQELAAILRHELRAPITLAMGGYSAEAGRILEHCTADNPPPANLGDFMVQKQPSPELLKLIKKFAKSSSVDGAEAGLPREISLLLYFVSIAIARLRCQVRISELPDDALSNGLNWVLSQNWVIEPVRSLAGEALSHLGQSEMPGEK